MTLSLNDLQIAASAVEVEMTDDEGNATGIKLMVRSSQADEVVEKTNAIEDERRRKMSLREAKAAKTRAPEPVFESSAESQSHIRRAAAVRVAGWNLKEEASEANVVELFKLRPGFIIQVLEAANDTGRFSKASPKG